MDFEVKHTLMQTSAAYPPCDFGEIMYSPGSFFSVLTYEMENNINLRRILKVLSEMIFQV